MDWEKTKSRIESRECCKHIGGRMFVDKVGLSCCRGTATSCKGAEFLFWLICYIRNPIILTSLLMLKIVLS